MKEKRAFQPITHVITNPLFLVTSAWRCCFIPETNSWRMGRKKPGPTSWDIPYLDEPDILQKEY